MELDPITAQRIRERAERRFEELKIDAERFMARFDENGDGQLDPRETSAAIATLSHELLRESRIAENLVGESIPPETVLADRFRIVSEIGNGAQGITYAARDQQTNQLVVVKQLRLSHIDAWDAYDSFRREIQILKAVSHPKLPELIDAFELQRDGHYYFAVQELLPGRNLEDLSVSGELFDEEDLFQIAHQVLEILVFLHSNNPAILHRDIKPSNLLMDDDGQIYLVDFGAVQYADVSKTLAVGTAGYMPPEQLAGAAVPASDLYGLGATLIRLATRTNPQNLPFNRMRLQWRDKASISAGFGNWIDKMIDPEVEDRFRSAAVALKFLDDPASVFVRRESPIDAKFSLEPVEVTERKPQGSKVQMWESVDALICSFPGATRHTPNSFFGKFGALMTELFSTNLKQLTATGGGFSLSASKTLDIQTHTHVKFGKRIFHHAIDTLRYDDRSDGVFAILGEYTTSDGETTTTHQEICFVSNNRAERDWVLDRMVRFSRDHALKLA